ncbi:glycosyltransferase family 8 protein [Latilactobacillus fuchuensis]|jgi:lipopolysaccharide biosynthesis glycosyltransferase|uniref:UDP-galactose:(Galactosyl) LPS alpha1,2-galactosyltransferase WaaW n=2 Tax=Latilactobacillus fuchuensis TaxID=164393 RepID=A0A2N9DXX9_9LACO|nr:glycosyltransferase family 8 protein [Latilactobacillus fuchuensis]KRL61642.1 lipopolysaccharide glycosyltransferase [Latilactobacillus fuchuensis DSM 14340 = JCM 11249]SPC39706.1 UDP-galactose:(Galactosyl) LPS alpha1,2-galactosyltransferase WaaW [Latilactobacillus fuchuensis]
MPLNLLFSIDDHFVPQFKTTLFSIVANTAATDLAVYVIQKNRLVADDDIHQFCQQFNIAYYPVIIGEDPTFKDAPVSKRYPEAIYYRLLAHKYLPQDLTKILYLDADILCINDLLPLYNLDLGTDLYAAASHASLTNVPDVVNKIRLGTYEADGYFNSGVLLMNLPLIRQTVSEKAIFDRLAMPLNPLLLPDQDVLNALYGHQILTIPDEVYNYDVRKPAIYEAISHGTWDLDWLVQNNVFLHFCGKEKPWLPSAKNKFSLLYKHYQHLAGQS